MNGFIDWATRTWWRVIVIWLVALASIALSCVAFAEGGDGSGGSRAWGDRSTAVESNYRRGAGIVGMVTTIAGPAWNAARRFDAYIRRQGPLAMAEARALGGLGARNHAQAGGRSIGGLAVGQDGRIAGGI